MDKQTKIQAVIFVLIGFISGFMINDFLKGEDIAKVITKTEFKSDTVYVQKTDTVHVTRTQIIHEHIRDTVLIGYEPKISRFQTFSPFLYGNTYVNGEVLGEVLKIDIRNDFKLPTITNTIKKTETIIKKPSGIFLTAGVNHNFSNPVPYIGAVFVRDKYLLGLNTSGVQFGYKISH